MLRGYGCIHFPSGFKTRTTPVPNSYPVAGTTEVSLSTTSIMRNTRLLTLIPATFRRFFAPKFPQLSQKKSNSAFELVKVRKAVCVAVLIAFLH